MRHRHRVSRRDELEGRWTGGNHLKIYDLSDPARPVYIRDFGMVGTQPNVKNGGEGEGIHGAISAGVEKNRVYIAYGTGNDGSSIAEAAHPVQEWVD
jgi:hypothetical protein